MLPPQPERQPSQEDIDAFCVEEHYIFGVLLPRTTSREIGYQIAFVLPTVEGGGQIGIGGLSNWEGMHERYTFTHLLDAIAAFAVWRDRDHFEGEPEHWVRHQPSNRRRRYSSTGYTEDVRA